MPPRLSLICPRRIRLRVWRLNFNHPIESIGPIGVRRWRPPWWFLAGVLLGWLVIGWWLWPVQWTDAAPWHLSPQHQRVYVSLIADDYSQSANVATVTQALTGWNRNDLSNLLTTMQHETSDPLTQQHLGNLISVLQLPGSEVYPVRLAGGTARHRTGVGRVSRALTGRACSRRSESGTATKISQ